jgi:saposin
VGVEKANFIPHIIVTNEILDNTIDGQIIDSGECLLCTSVVGGAESKISQSMTKQQIEDVLLRECSKFHPYQGICDNFVEKNVDEIVDLLSKRMTPKEICQKLSLCAIEDDLNIDEAVIINVVAIPAVPIVPGRVSLTKDDTKKNVQDDPMCVLCEFIMAKLEQELKDKHTQEEIKQAVENICSKMPKSISKACTTFVDNYAELIMTLINTVPPKEICTEMSLCTPTKKKMHLVGDSECTCPTHFCGDLKVAEKCKATEYCKKQKIGMFA